jgi:hypothetical protein
MRAKALSFYLAAAPRGARRNQRSALDFSLIVHCKQYVYFNNCAIPHNNKEKAS